MSSLQIPCPQCGSELKLRDRSLLGRKGKCPKCGHAFILEEPDEVELELAPVEPAPAVGTAAQWVPDQPTPSISAPTPAFPTLDQPPLIPALAIPAAVAGSSLVRKKKHGSPAGWILTAVVLLAAGGAGAYVYWNPKAAVTNAPPPPPAEPAALPAAPAAPAAVAVTASPTQGEPIDLKLIPFGARVVIHLRPAELWVDKGWPQEFRLSLGPLADYLQQQLKALTGRDPERIEEVLFCLIPNERETPPDFCMVVHLKEPARRSDLIEQFGGERVEDFGPPVYVTGDRAWFIQDEKTFAMCPAKVAGEMVDAQGRMHPAAAGIDELLPMTDHTRLITVVGDVMQARLDSRFLAPGNLNPLFERVLDWFGDDVETVAWSVHQAENVFYSQLLARNRTVIQPRKLETILKGRLDELPHELVTLIRYMQPREAGPRTVIGRVPAMTKVVALATQTDVGPRHVELITSLPAKAGPNLALGTLLAWDESTRTDFSRTMSAPPAYVEKKLPDKVADRLKLKMDFDYRRSPLQEAIAFIADEIKVEFRIDGDALKAAGYTQNMPATFKMDQATPMAAILEIANQNSAPLICIVVDEEKKQVTLTTRTFAADKGLKEFPLEP
ncbi:MAG TPA: hypothetical protein VL132_20770 [Planctomycetaceae bacterium]|nr:hypothetical protein [Planctomycetaceae bacterium]